MPSVKLLLLIFTFSITFALNIEAVEYDKETIALLREWNVYFGDPRENKIIGQGDMYVVIHNPTELALTVMRQRAKDYCKQTLGNNFTSNFMEILNRYTAYFSCEMPNKINQYNLSKKEKICIKDRDLKFKSCLKLNKKNVDIINIIELQEINEEKYTTNNFIYSVRTKFYDQIEILEQVAEDKRINNIKETEYKRNQLKIEKNIEICKSYNFEEGSQLLGECILKLIELE